MNADLDTLIALYVALTDDIIPSRGSVTGPGRPPEVTDAELVCLAVAQAYHEFVKERAWLREAPSSWATCSRGCWIKASTTGGCARSAL